MTTCPACHAPVPPDAPHCPACHAPMLALPNGTRLYQQYRVDRALRREEHLRYLATDERDGQTVLIDEFFPAGSRRLGNLVILPGNSAGARDAWTQRASALQGDCPGQRRVQLTFEQHGTTYAVLSPPEGVTLRSDVLRRGRWIPGDVQTLLEHLQPALSSLGAAAGLVTPDRVTLTPDGPLLDLTATPVAPAYQAPEHLRGEPLDTWAAVAYSLGATLSFALSGQDPPGAAQLAIGMPLPTPPVGTPDTLIRTMTACLAGDVARRPARTDLLGGPAAPVVTASRSAVKVIRAHGSWVTHLLLHGSQIISAGADLSIRLTSVSGEAQERLDGLRGQPTGLSMRPEGLVAADTAGWLHLWRGHQLSSVQGAEGTTHMTAYGDDQVLTVTSGMNLTLWNTAPLRPLGSQRAGEQVITAVQALTNRMIVVGTARGEVMVVHPDQGAVTPLLPPERRGPIGALATDGRNVYVASGSDILRVGQTQPIVTLGAPVSALQVLPDGRLVAVAGRRVLVHDHSGTLTELHAAAHDLHGLVVNAEWIVAGTQAGELIICPTPFT